MEKDNLHKAVLEHASDGINPAGENYLLLSLADTRRLVRKNNISGRLIELAALEVEVIPERYQRSIGTIGLGGQIKLLHSTVGIVGAGGLGGFVLELLARMGVGKLIVIDGDSFSDSNLNRQLLATESTLQQPKVEQAAKRIADINGSVEVEIHHCRGDLANMPEIFSDCDLVIDCLDNLPSRFDVEKVCQQLNIVMIHGAIAGFIGQLAVIRPKRPLLSTIYSNAAKNGTSQGVEVQIGNPAVTPAMVASFQACEAVKYLAGLDNVLPGDKLFIIDMQSGRTCQVDLN